MKHKLVEAMTEDRLDKKAWYGLQLFAEGDTGEDTDPNPAKEEKEDDDADEEDDVKKYTDEEVDALIERKFAEWQKKQEKQQKKQDEADRLRNMSEQERKDAELETLRKQVEALEKKDATSKMAATARSMLSEKGISVGDELVSMLISDDADTTKRAVDSFITAFQSAVKKAVKDALKGEAPRKGGASGMTKEQIMAVKDRAERQKLIRENMHLFR